MPYEFTTERRVEFAETDMAGIVHFSNFFRYMEATEHAFFRSLGLSLHEQEGDAMRGWARVHAACEYRKPLRYQDLVRIHLRVLEKRSSTLTYAFEFRVAGDEELAARGELRVCSVTRSATGERMSACPMPDDIARRIEVAPGHRTDDVMKEGVDHARQ